MRPKAPLASRYAAILMALATLMHAIVALDLMLHFFPATPEFQALWATSRLVKALWLAFVALGAVSVVMLYKSPIVGLFFCLAATIDLYFASHGLWGDLKGGFWFAAVATLLAAWGGWRGQRSNNSFKGMPLRGTP